MEIEKRVDNLEAKVIDMDKNISVFTEIMKRFDGSINKFSDTIEKFSDAMDDIKITLVMMESEIKVNKEDTIQLTKKVDTIDNKSKFDFMLWIRDKVIPYLIVGGVVFALFKVVGL